MDSMFVPGHKPTSPEPDIRFNLSLSWSDDLDLWLSMVTVIRPALLVRVLWEGTALPTSLSPLAASSADFTEQPPLAAA